MTDRIKNSIINIIVQFLSNLIIPVIGFFRVSFMINYFGSALNGVVQVFTQVMSLLQLTEVGFGASFNVALYKPIQQKDFNKVNEIYNANAFFQHIVAFILFVLALLSFFILPFFIDEEVLSLKDSFILFIAFSMPFILNQLFNARLVLLRALQKEYKFYRIYQFCNSARLILSLFLISHFTFFTYILLDSLLSALSYIIAYSSVRKYISRYNSLTKKKDLSPAKTTRYVVFQSVSNMVNNNTDNLVLSYFLSNGLSLVSVYNSYMYIVTTIDNFLASIILSVVGSVGDLFASKVDYAYYTFKQIFYSVSVIALCCAICTFVGANDFISMWIQNSDISYLLSRDVVFLFSTVLFYKILKRPIDLILNSNNLFKYTAKYYLLAALCNLIISIFLVQKIGIKGVLIGTIISYFCIDLLFTSRCAITRGLDQNYFIFFIKFLIIFLFYLFESFICINIFNFEVFSFFDFILKMIVCFIFLFFVNVIVFSFIFEEFRDIINKLTGFIKSFVSRFR